MDLSGVERPHLTLSHPVTFLWLQDQKRWRKDMNRDMKGKSMGKEDGVREKFSQPYSRAQACSDHEEQDRV